MLIREAGTETTRAVGTEAWEGYKDEKRDQARPWCGQGDPCPSPLRVCSVRSVDGSPTTAFTVLECEGSRRLGSRPRRYLLTGQANGSLAMWDLTTAMVGLGQAPGTPRSSPIPSPTDSPCTLSTTSFAMSSLPKPLPSGPFPWPPTPPRPCFLTSLS